MNRVAGSPFSTLLHWLDYQCTRRSHVLMETWDRREGFGLFGGFRVRHRFAAMYLPSSERLRTRVAIHGKVTAEACRTLVERCGLVVFCGESAPFDLTPDIIRMPVSVDMQAAVPQPIDGPDAPWTRSAKANIAKIKRRGFTFDVVDADPSRVTAFCRLMFWPSMRSRHGNAASVETERALVQLAQVEGGELLRVWQKSEWAAAAIGRSTPDGYRLLKLGWLNGDDALIRSGIVSSLYWFAFQRAALLGHQRVLLGSVEPYLENGVLRHKAYWGAELMHESRQFGDFQLLVEPSHPVCRRFLQRHSLVIRGADGDLIVFSGRTPDAGQIAPSVLKEIARWYVWCESPSTEPGITCDEVPRKLRPWLARVPLPASH